MRKLGIALPAVLALSALLSTSAGAHIPVGAATHAVAINHSTGLAYVSAECTCGGSIVVIDTATDTVVTTITTASTPGHIAVDEERNQIFAAHFTGGVSVIDGDTNTVRTTLPFGGLGLAVNPVRDLLYATLGPGGLAVYDLTTLAHDRTVPVATTGANWWGVAVNPVTDRIYVENLLGAVDVLHGETYAHIKDISIFGEARFGVTVDIAANLVYVPRYVANGRVHVIDGATNTLRSGFGPSGSFPRALALDTAAERLYSADLGSGTITVFSTAGTLTRLETISVGGQPNGIALPTRGPKRLYVTNQVPGDLTVIPISDNAAPTVISVTTAPTSPDTNDTLTATVVAQDPDGDPLTYSYQWTRNGTAIAGATSATLDLAGSGNGDRGDAIAVRVTASDGTANSDPLTSAAVIVVNSAPVMVAATIAPQSPDTDDVLTATAVAQDKDLESLTYSYQWTRNGADISGATGATLDLAVSGNGDRGDSIAVRVTASDGTATSDPLTSAAVTVVNGPPVVISAAITPTSPDTDDVLNATVVAQDVDGDALTYSYQWTKNGADIAGAIGDSLDLAISSNGDHGDVIRVRVTANDGSDDSAPLTSAGVTVINSAPAMISATIAPTAPDTDDILTATVAAQDLDGDPLGYSYQWTKNGADIAGAIGATLDLGVSGNGDRGHAIAVRVKAHDGNAFSEPLTSASVTVVNSAPSMISATIAPTSPDTDDLLTATPVAQDPDGDQLTYAYQWTKNGTDILGATGATFDLAVSGNGDSGDAIAVRVTADDGSAISGPLTSASVTVTHNSAPIVVSAAIAPTSPDTDDVLTATVVAQDPDGDPLAYSYQWTRNGIDIPEATDQTLDLALSGNGNRGEAIAVRVTASDGSAVSDPLTSASVTVVNSAPFASVTLDVIKPSHKDVVTATVAVTDPDPDTLTLTLTYVWRVEGVVRRTVTTTATSDTFDLSDPRNGSPHDTIILTVTPNDGLTDGAAATATAIVLPGN